MPYDFKKELKSLYCPKTQPALVTVPKANYIAVRGQGDPNEADGAYQRAIRVLYAVSYTLKMAEKGGRAIAGFFPYAVPPLEGFWQQEGGAPVDFANKAGFRWISVIRLPDFVTEADFAWAKEQAASRKKLDCADAEFLPVDEGLCVQAMHLGAFDDEPATVERMNRFLEQAGYETDLSDSRLHHEIYLSDPRKAPPEKWKTVIRHPVRQVP